MTTFYVRPDGNDAASGRSDQRAWRSITKVNLEAAAGRLRHGDTIRFLRGATFYGKVVAPDLSPDVLGMLRYTCYGDPSLPLPKLSSYKRILTWEPAGESLWSVDLGTGAFGSTYEGYDNGQGGDANVGHLIVDGEVKSVRVWSVDDLANDWDFYVDAESAPHLLIVRHAGGPPTSGVLAAVNGNGFRIRSCVEVDHLHITGSGSHGIKSANLDTVYVRQRIHHNEVSWCGGARLYGQVRYGNGVELWSDTEDATIEFNVVHDIYDAAFTAQGPGQEASARPAFWRDVHFRHNLTYRCSQDVEFWNTSTSVGFENVSFERNLCLFGGWGWGAEVRPNQTHRVAFLTALWLQPGHGMSVSHNIFWGAHAYRRHRFGELPAGVRSDWNLIAMHPGALLMTEGEQVAIESAQSWASDNHVEVGSRFDINPALPQSSPNDAQVRSAFEIALSLRDGASKARIGSDPGFAPLAAALAFHFD